MGYTNILIKKIAYSFGKILPDKLYLSIRYMITFKKKINWKDPRSFNEKIQWLKMYDRKPEYVEMVDKATVKSYISKKIGEQYVIPTLGVWDSFEEIDFDILPDKFVFKCTHDSGGVILCKDKSKFDIAAAGNKLSKCLKHNTYYGGREWVYKDIKPRIIAEKLLEDLEGENVLDYKFFCFNGHVKYFKIDFDRFNDHRANYYDLSMNC
jgi:hypothetical protein